MRRLFALTLSLCLAALGPAAAQTMIEDFTMQPESRWRFFTDGVMGGISTGRVEFIREGGQTHARMSGRVSTENRGGFIQMQLELPDAAPPGTTGVRAMVRGNGQRYFIHLRTTGTLLPWQYYQAGFDAGPTWQEVRLPFSAFAPSGALLRSLPRAQSLTSVAVVAYGRDHEARVEVREIGFY